jgi:phosphatidylinositol glycan class T
MFRKLGGSGQERGKLMISLHNDQNSAVDVTLLETIPWIVKLYMHGMKITTTTNFRTEVTQPSKVLYTPSKDRVRPTVLELFLSLPPKSVTQIHIDLEYAFIKVAEHYPDANYGFDIGYVIY